MNLKKRLSKEVSIIGFIFGILLIITTSFFLQFSQSFDDVLTQSEPALDALNHMLVNVYEDHILIMEYLQTTSYAESLAISQALAQADLKCEAFEQNMRNLIETKKITDEVLIEDYQNAFSLHEQVEAFRDQLISLHEKEITTKTYTSSQKREILGQYTDLFDESTLEFQSKIEALQTRNTAVKRKLLAQSRLFVVVILLLLLACVLTIVRKVRQISKRIIEPVDQTIDATKQFIAGEYDFQIKPNTNITEISDLQDNINAVFKAVNTVAKSDETQKKSIQKNLLKKEYVAILDFLAKMETEHKKVTMRDVKQQFNITHPTALSRIKYLEEHNHVRVQKEGRDKCLLLV